METTKLLHRLESNWKLSIFFSILFIFSVGVFLTGFIAGGLISIKVFVPHKASVMYAETVYNELESSTPVAYKGPTGKAAQIHIRPKDDAN